MLRGRRLRGWWGRAFWVVPFVGILVALALASLLESIDESVFELDSTQLSPSAAQTFLAAVGGGMVTFTGFVFSVVLLMLQYGSSTYSPRVVSFFVGNRVTQAALAVFLGTITFSFAALFSVGSEGRADFVPLVSVSFSLLLLLASLIGFLALIQVVATQLKVDSLLTSLGRTARRRLAEQAGIHHGHGASTPGRLPEPDADDTLLRHEGRPGQLVGVDIRRLRRSAERSGARVVVLVRLGDGVSRGTPVARVLGGDLRGDGLGRALLVEPERSLRYDPWYALRLVVDVGVRALSPAVNDPTTAVRSLDEIEGVLREAGRLPLGPVTLPAGRGEVVLQAATWADVVDLALVEILEAGVGAPQVTRRLSALLADLVGTLAADRHEPLLTLRRRLVLHVTARVPADDLPLWLTGDRQGLGGSG